MRNGVRERKRDREIEREREPTRRKSQIDILKEKEK